VETPLHSMIWSGRASTVGGISMPSVFGLEINQLKLGRLFDGQISWVCSSSTFFMQ
jgi:hypothetical protein